MVEVTDALLEQGAFAVWALTMRFEGSLDELKAKQPVNTADLGEGYTLEQDLLMDWEINRDTYMTMARTVVAALSLQGKDGAVEIKPLEWDERSGAFYADTVFGEVCIDQDGDGFYAIENGRKHSDFPTAEAAQAFVQKNHDKWVSDWLEPSPSLAHGEAVAAVCDAMDELAIREKNAGYGQIAVPAKQLNDLTKAVDVLRAAAAPQPSGPVVALEDATREAVLNFKSKLRISFRKALSDLPEIAPPEVASVLSSVHMRDEFLSEGKRLQREHGTDAVAPRVEQECGAGAWSFMRQGVIAALTSGTPSPAQGPGTRVRVPDGQTPLNDKLDHPLLDAIREGERSRDTGKPSPYHGHSLEHCLHATGWVSRDLRLALDAAKAPSPAQGPMDGAVPTHRHKKRGTEYVLIGIGKMQSADWRGPRPLDGRVLSVDMREVAIYRSVDDGSFWVRPREEFEDGRFEALASAPAQGPMDGAVPVHQAARLSAKGLAAATKAMDCFTSYDTPSTLAEDCIRAYLDAAPQPSTRSTSTAGESE